MTTTSGNGEADFEYVYEAFSVKGNPLSREHLDEVTAGVNAIAQYGWRLVGVPTKGYSGGESDYSMWFERPRKPVEG